MAANKRPRKKYSPKRNPLAADRFKAALGMAAWKHYVRAIKESVPVLDAEAHKQREKQAA